MLSLKSFASSSLLKSKALLLCPAATQFHHCAFWGKDKNFKDTPAAPRKSKFQSEEPTEGKIRSDEEKKKLNEERKQREEKKQAIRAKQLEIQAKRNASTDEKKTKKSDKAKKADEQD